MELIVLDKLRSLNRRIAILTGIVLLACAVVVLLDIILRRFGPISLKFFQGRSATRFVYRTNYCLHCLTYTRSRSF